jgi:FtsH-binding integral membrane protein
MTEHPDLDELARRPRRYWTIDGLPELTVGMLWVTWGGAWLVGTRLPHDWRSAAYWLIVAPVLALMGFAVNRITRRLKERITFPRAGYVEWSKPSNRVSLGYGLAIGGAAAVFRVVNMSVTGGDARLERAVPLAVTVCLALSFVAVSVRQRTPHHLAVAAAAVVLALAIFSVTTGWDAMNWLFLGLGAICVLTGAIRLALFLRSHPLPVGDGL